MSMFAESITFFNGTALTTVHESHSVFHYSVNDIVAVGVDSFYATNTRYFHNAVVNLLSLVFWLAWTDVVYYSPKEVKVVATGISSANGINISPDQRLVI